MEQIFSNNDLINCWGTEKMAPSTNCANLGRAIYFIGKVSQLLTIMNKNILFCFKSASKVETLFYIKTYSVGWGSRIFPNFLFKLFFDDFWMLVGSEFEAWHSESQYIVLTTRLSRSSSRYGSRKIIKWWEKVVAYTGPYIE